jgi:hypothetical protein
MYLAVVECTVEYIHHRLSLKPTPSEGAGGNPQSPHTYYKSISAHTSLSLAYIHHLSSIINIHHHHHYPRCGVREHSLGDGHVILRPPGTPGRKPRPRKSNPRTPEQPRVQKYFHLQFHFHHLQLQLHAVTTARISVLCLGIIPSTSPRGQYSQGIP